MEQLATSRTFSSVNLGVLRNFPVSNMSASLDLTASKKNLEEALGDSMKVYANFLKAFLTICMLFFNLQSLVARRELRIFIIVKKKFLLSPTSKLFTNHIVHYRVSN